MQRNPLFQADNFLVPQFPFAWPLNDVESDYLKGWLALAAAAILLFLARPRGLARPRLEVSVLAALVGLAALCYTNFLTFHGPRGEGYRLVHAHDFFHYAMGSKYFPELGHGLLYEASLVALEETSGDPNFLAGKFYRETRTDRLLRASTLGAKRAEIRALFGDERWREFKADTEFFRRLRGEKHYLEMYADHGYNPSPISTSFSRLVTARVDFTPDRLVWLFLLDPALLVAAFVALGWAFGARGALLVALLFLLNHPGRWAWVGGSLLRMPWFVALCCGVACAGRSRPIAAGFFLGCAAGFRGFPGLVLVALAGPFLWEWLERGRGRAGALVRSRRAREAVTIALSAAATLALLVVVSSLTLGRQGAWGEWLSNSRAHAGRFALNSIGLRPALAFDPDVTSTSVKREYREHVLDPGQYGLPDAAVPGLSAYYESVKEQLLSGRRWAYALLLAAGWASFALATRRATAAQAIVLGLSLIFFSGLNVTSYYWVFLVLLPLHAVTAEAPSWRGAYGLTAVLLLVIVVEYWIAQAFADLDVIFGLESILFLMFLLGLLATEAGRAMRARAP